MQHKSFYEQDTKTEIKSITKQQGNNEHGRPQNEHGIQSIEYYTRGKQHLLTPSKTHVRLSQKDQISF